MSARLVCWSRRQILIENPTSSWRSARPLWRRSSFCRNRLGANHDADSEHGSRDLSSRGSAGDLYGHADRISTSSEVLNCIASLLPPVLD